MHMLQTQENGQNNMQLNNNLENLYLMNFFNFLISGNCYFK